MAELDKLLDIVGVGRHDDAVRQQPGKAARAERLRQRLLGCGSRPPRRGGIEAAFAETGLGLGLGLAVAHLGQARAENLSAPDRIRMQGIYQHTPVIDAFDGILSTPASTTTDLEKP
ncbi:hypothetical protein [Streptomyces aureus]|uniref:Uncharacterized protein n=1 Tax=Streptomyces aureus TaxID=193461 RepID=A0ABV4SX25_9ACTN